MPDRFPMNSFTRRRALQALSGVAASLGAAPASAAPVAELFVSPAGNDAGPGTKARPLKTFTAAQQAARKLKSKTPVTVWFRSGIYYLPHTVVFTAEDSGSKLNPVTFAAFPGEEAVISGGVKLSLTWEPHRDGIMKAQAPADLKTDQIFLNGQRQILARYPNYDPKAEYFDGWSPDAFSKERAARWADPSGGFIHAMHRAMWGDFHYLITGKNAAGEVTYEGGWQNNRRMGMHDKYRFVENIFEELDAPGEWFLNEKTSTLYFYPPPDINLRTATIEAARLPHLIEFRGTEQSPVKWVNLRGLIFRHTARTFMENKEPLLRSDWTTYRGGALFFNGAENCDLEDCFLDQVGGNAVFVNMYNQEVAIRRCHIAKAGANGLAFVGDPKAVRSPLFEYEQRQSFKDIDLSPGPKTNNYPSDCLVDNCLIYLTGRVEKQTAGVQISMSRGITVRHCSIYDMPRAGINISEGTWGGHVIEFCDVFDTVKETGDHGSFNSWGRDRYWGLKDIDLNTVTTGPYRNLPLADVLEPIVLHNSRWRCDHGWDIDLDDGSSNYHVYNNLALNGGIKNREGFFRTVENNVMVDNSFHPHVWYGNSEDVFRRNIVFTAYKPIRVNPPWGKEFDYNLLHAPGRQDPQPAAGLQKQSGRDTHSMEADALFVNPAAGDYRVRGDSPALKLGFVNFPMDQFGVQAPNLKAIARTPELPGAGRPASAQSGRDGRTAAWRGATVKNVVGLGEVSASGLPGEVGVLVLAVPPQSQAAALGLRQGDVILKIGGQETDALADLLRLSSAAAGRRVTVFRDQHEVVLGAL
jgi:hypothetical protein